jgi:hypothetical protein
MRSTGTEELFLRHGSVLFAYPHMPGAEFALKRFLHRRQRAVLCTHEIHRTELSASDIRIRAFHRPALQNCQPLLATLKHPHSRKVMRGTYQL